MRGSGIEPPFLRPRCRRSVGIDRERLQGAGRPNGVEQGSIAAARLVLGAD